MFCFQSPFSRTSRASLSQTKLTRELPRRNSEAASEDSVSSIKYIDQLSVSDASDSTDTLPNVCTDYLDADPLSPGPEMPSSPHEPLIFNEKKSWSQRLMLSIKSTDSLSSGKTSPPSSASEGHLNQNGEGWKKQSEPLVASPGIFTMVNGIPTSDNEFSDPDENVDSIIDDDDDDLDDDECNRETEPEDAPMSFPSSPTATANSGAPFYGFLSVNGGMRQDSTSTSSPQLSTTPKLNSESLKEDSGSFTEETSSKAHLKPERLEATACLPVARSCPNLEGQSAASSASGSSSPSPGLAGPRFKPIEEGDIQICYLNHSRTLASKILSSKFLRRWETHHLYLNDACLSSRTLTGFLQQPVPYSSMTEVYAVARWDPTYKYYLRIVLPVGSLLLQACNAYTRDQWYHSILWKKSMYKYQQTISTTAKEDVILRELKSLVDFALWTPLQDERVTGAPLEAVAKLLEENSSEKDEEKSDLEHRTWAEAVLAVAAPLLEKAAPPQALARVLAKLAQKHPRSPLVMAHSPAITRCLKHTVDFGKSPDMRRLLQVFIAALYENDDGEQAIREYVASIHGPGSDCPHPRVLPNLVSICLAAIFHRFEVVTCLKTDVSSIETLPPLQCYLHVLNVASEYTDWRPGLGALLQPVPFPENALADKQVQKTVMLCVMRHLALDPRCIVHKVLLPVREPRHGWIHIAAPSSKTCPDDGELFGEMLTTLLGCCCRRKRFISSLMKQAGGACTLLAVRGCEAAQDALCLMLEWRLLPKEEDRLQVVSALQSTASGKDRYAALCQRQKNLQELQQKGGPKKLTLPVRATDADVALLLGGGALGNLEFLSLAFTSVTSACAEQLIKLPALRYLNLWATQFGDTGLQMISEHLQKLQVLNLCETPVSDKGISTLASMTSLRKLNLNSTKLSAQTFESLKKSLSAKVEFDVRYTEAW